MLIPKVSDRVDIVQDIPPIDIALESKQKHDSKYAKAYKIASDVQTDNPVEEPENKYAEPYRIALKSQIDNKPLEESLPLATNYIRVNNALSAPSSNFPDTNTAILARDAKVSINFARNNPDEAQEMASKRKFNRRLLTESVAKEISNNPESTSILKDDLDNFDKLYQILNYEEHTKGKTTDSYLDKISNVLDAGSATAEMADYSSSIREALSNGLPIPEDIRMKLDELNLTAQAGTRDGNWLSIASVASTRIAPPLADSAKQALYRGVEGAAIGGAIGSVIPGIGTAGMAAYTAGTGAWIGFAESTYDQTYASSAFAYSQLKVEGELLDNETVNNAATMEAVISTSLDLASFKVLGGLFGSAGNSIRKIITSTLETPAGRKIFSELAKNVLKGTGKVAGAVAAESATEATQEIVLDAFGEMAKQWTSEKRGGDYEAQDILRPEVIDKAIDAGN